jgi:hypothetical protein
MDNSKDFYSQEYNLSNWTVLFAKEICFLISRVMIVKARLFLFYKKKKKGDK